MIAFVLNLYLYCEVRPRNENNMFFVFAFLLCYAGLCKTYFPPIIMVGLTQRNASQGELGLPQRLKMKL